MRDVVAHLQYVRLGFEEVDDRLVAPGQRAQVRFVVWVGQAAHVEDELGVERQAVLEAEGFEGERQRLRLVTVAVGCDELAYPLAQRVGLQVAGVDVMAEFGDAGEAYAFLGDGLGQRALVAGQRVPAPRLRVALAQRLGLRVEKEELHVVLLRTQRVELLRQRFNTAAAADVDGDGDFPVALLPELIDERLQQLRRQIVDAVVRGVLEQVEGDRFAGPGKAADDQDVHGLEHSGTALPRASRAGVD